MAARVQDQRDAKSAEAKGKGEKIVREATSRAADRYAKGLDQVNNEVAQQKERARQLAQSEGEKSVLAAQHDVTTGVVAEARERLSKVASEASFGSVIEALLAEAMGAARGDVIVLSPPAHADRCKTWLAANGHSAAEVVPTDEFDDGVAVQDTGHSYRVTNTLSSRFRKLEPLARKILMKRLFGHEGSP
jgi:vacuolar-type H+-ATPase subunit E/Vma4